MPLRTDLVSGAECDRVAWSHHAATEAMGQGEERGPRRRGPIARLPQAKALTGQASAASASHAPHSVYLPVGRKFRTARAGAAFLSSRAISGSRTARAAGRAYGQ